MSRAATYELRDISVNFGNVIALSGLSLEVGAGELIGVAGPNGAGKSTLLRVLAGLQTFREGRCTLDGIPLARWKRRTLATRVAYVAQQTHMIFPYSAAEVVLMGRLPRQKGHFFETSSDRQAVRSAMESTDCLHLSDRIFHTLSGGEQQLVILASVLAQQPEILLLDEPTAFLDLRHQLQIGGILDRLHRQQELTIILATHDLRLAESLSDRLLLLKSGQLMADVAGRASGPSGLTAELVGELFDLSATDVRRVEEGRLELVFRS